MGQRTQSSIRESLTDQETKHFIVHSIAISVTGFNRESIYTQPPCRSINVLELQVYHVVYTPINCLPCDSAVVFVATELAQDPATTARYSITKISESVDKSILDADEIRKPWFTR